MSEQEKMLLLQLLLEDLRGNWAYAVEERLNHALKLAIVLCLPEHIRSIQNGREDQANGWFDGRMFRMGWNSGGYEDGEKAHGLPLTISDKSDEFKQTAGTLLTYPSYRLEDWDAYLETLP